jgi:arginase
MRCRPGAWSRGDPGAGLIDQLDWAGFEVSDVGDSAVVPWRPDRLNPRAQNLDAVSDVVRTTASRAADVPFGDDRLALVLGGDCTVGIGTIAGVQRAVGPVGLVYFDLHADLNTPASATDGALDWMALGHMLAIEGSEPQLVAAAEGDGRALLAPGQVVLFAHGQSQSTRFERSEIERLGIERVAVEDVRGDPDAAARRALDLLAPRADRYAIHLDVDVVDFTDAPLSEHPSRNVGLSLDAMLRALTVLSLAPGLVAITLAELNPHNAAADEGFLSGSPHGSPPRSAATRSREVQRKRHQRDQRRSDMETTLRTATSARRVVHRSIGCGRGAGLLTRGRPVDAPMMLLLHGFSSGSHQFRRLIDASEAITASWRPTTSPAADSVMPRSRRRRRGLREAARSYPLRHVRVRLRSARGVSAGHQVPGVDRRRGRPDEEVGAAIKYLCCAVEPGAQLTIPTSWRSVEPGRVGLWFMLLRQGRGGRAGRRLRGAAERGG